MIKPHLSPTYLRVGGGGGQGFLSPMLVHYVPANSHSSVVSPILKGEYSLGMWLVSRGAYHLARKSGHFGLQSKGKLAGKRGVRSVENEECGFSDESVMMHGLDRLLISLIHNSILITYLSLFFL